MNEQKEKRRALILAGGGLKVAFQAGVLQVWLDEAELSFFHADAASGGVFNLAMLCQGMSGAEIAAHWRAYEPLEAIGLNDDVYVSPLFARSMFTLDGLRERIFPAWGLDWQRIRAYDGQAAFNIYNFSKHQLEVVPASKMSEDHLLAAVALPMWFPPVPIAGDLYIDAVFVTDANLEEAIRRGADELWVIWTVSDKGEWRDGFVANYFQVIEAAANGQFKQILARIHANNQALAAGQAGEFGRRIDLKILKAEVPVHYLVNLGSDEFAETVELGIEAGRRFCRDNHIPLKEPSRPPLRAERGQSRARMEFTEELHGYVTLGERDCRSGYREGRRRGTALDYHLTLRLDDVDRFIAHPAHEVACTGYVQCQALGGRLSVEQGVVNLLVADEKDPSMKRMFYRLHLRDGSHQALTLFGHKEVVDDPGFDAWSDTTTLFVTIAKGHLAEAPKDDAIIGAGILRLGAQDLFRMLATFRAEAPTAGARAAAMARFGRAFLGKLWDVYARG